MRPRVWFSHGKWIDGCCFVVMSCGTLEAMNVCPVIDCTKPVRRNGYCITHEARWRKWGNALIEKRVTILTREEAIQYLERNRVFNKVRPNLSPCWEWTRSRITGPEPYGIACIRVGVLGNKNRIRKVHRIAAILWNGFDPNSDLDVLHHCDNPPCFNPEHLFSGDQTLNNKDRHAKGRSRNKFTTTRHV